MKNKLLIIALILASFGQAFSQNYYYYSSSGTAAPFSWNKDLGAATATAIMTAPANDILSAAQTLPFSWSFYGQTVTTYKASDNGYITFDPNATKSFPYSAALPDTNSSSAPRNAIFAFWTDLNFQSSSSFALTPSILTWTYGSAPNRVYVIEWAYASKQGVALGNTNLALFSIRLYEAGGFDIVHTTDQIAINNGVIGVQNADATLADMVEGSPYLGAPNPTGTGYNINDLVYNFKYGVQPKLDATMLSASAATSNNYYRRTVPTFEKGDNSISVSGVIANHGSLPISSISINYNVDNGVVKTDKLSGLSIPNNGGTYSFTHNVPYTASGVGQFHNIKVWFSNINDTFNETSNYDTTSEKIFVINGGTFNLTKKPLIENATGAWCPYCSDGHIDMENILSSNPQAVGLCYHYVDKMSINADYTLTNAYISSYPSLMVDRKMFDGQTSVAFAHTGTNDNPTVDAAVTQVVNNTTSIPVTLDITNKTWDPTTRNITFTVSGKFADYAGGDVRLSAIIAEDSVRGPDVAAPDPPSVATEGWDQANAYSKNWAAVGGSGSLLYNEAASIVGYVQNEVVWAVLNGDWGSNLDGFTGPNAIIPPNTNFSKTFTFKLPAQVNVDYSKTVKKPDATDYHSTFPGYGYYKPESIRLVAFVSNYNANDANFGEVLNATQAPLLGWSAGIAKYNQNIDKISLYPNPASNSTNVEYTLLHNTNLTVDVYNIMGQKVLSVANGTQIAGLHTLSIDATNLSNGMYFVTFTSNGEKTTKQLIIQK